MNLTTGTFLQGSKYRIISQLGQGGFGITYLAVQTALDRKVAIKEFFMPSCCLREGETTFVTISGSNDSGFAEPYKRKFIKEAKTIALLDNPHVIRIHDIFEENGTAYYVMEYLEGGDLKARTPDSGLPEADAVKTIRQIAETLEYIHHRNVLHLDIKPSNILFRKDGTAVLIDFGISKHYDENDGHQTSSTPIGISDGYAPLEQYDNGGVTAFTPTSDIYSLGATFYFLLTGQRPPSASEVLNQGLPQLPANVSGRLAGLVNKSMSVRKVDRPQSVSEFLSILDGTQDTDKDNDIITQEGIDRINRFWDKNEEIIKDGLKEVLDNVSNARKKRHRINLLKKIFLWLGLICIIVAIGFGIRYLQGKSGEVQMIGVDTDDSGYDIIAYKPVDLTTAPNGVYAVNKEGQGVPVEFADTSCVAVALIVNDAPVPQRIMIEKNETKNTTSIKAAYEAEDASNTGYNYFYWGMFDSEQGSIPTYNKVGGNFSSYSCGYLPIADGRYYSTKNFNLSGDYTTWKRGTALSDFSGKSNTAALKAAADNDVFTTYANMATWCAKFNEIPSENQNYSDWYIPACGQLALIYLNLRQINKALTAIGGTTIAFYNYWSSSEYSSIYGWTVNFGNAHVCNSGKGSNYLVRFVRDIQEENEPN